MIAMPWQLTIDQSFDLPVGLHGPQGFHWHRRQDGRHLAFLIAATASVQRAGTGAASKVGSQAGVRMLRQYLKGGALQVTKQAFRRVPDFGQFGVDLENPFEGKAQ